VEANSRLRDWSRSCLMAAFKLPCLVGITGDVCLSGLCCLQLFTQRVGTCLDQKWLLLINVC
jgi:hypothetical protein